jgi:hypothetical protein
MKKMKFRKLKAADLGSLHVNPVVATMFEAIAVHFNFNRGQRPCQEYPMWQAYFRE